MASHSLYQLTPLTESYITSSGNRAPPNTDVTTPLVTPNYFS